MQPISVTYPANATGEQTAIGLDWRTVPFSVSYLVSFDGSATGSVTIESTLDDVNNAAITPVWSASSAITSKTLAALTAPVQFVRINIGSLSGGTLTFKLLQGEYT